MPSIHYPYGPSSSSRWLNCPGSVKLSEGIERTTSVYAEEGTDAHSWLEACLTVGVSPTEVCDDPDMAAAVQEAVDVIHEIRKGLDVEEEWVEETLKSNTINDFGGTADYAVLGIDKETRKRVLHVLDYKHGAGVPVSAKDNTQLGCCLLLRLERIPENVDVFRASIVQPRSSNADVWQQVEWTIDELIELRRRIVEATQNQDELNAGSYCRWCPALGICPEVAKAAIEVAKASFPPVGSSEEVTDEMVEQWERIMDLGPAINKLIKEEIPRLMLERMQAGQEIPGWKVIEKYGNRTWRFDEEEVIKKLQGRKVGKKVTVVPKLRSVAQLERAGYTEQISDLWHKPYRGYDVVREHQKGEPVIFNAGEVFDEVPT